MIKALPLLLFIGSSQVWGCPGCLATSKDGSNDLTVYILGIFILLCYIPLYSLFKTIIKYRNINSSS